MAQRRAAVIVVTGKQARAAVTAVNGSIGCLIMRCAQATISHSGLIGLLAYSLTRLNVAVMRGMICVRNE
ncbi:MAG: hypothetical protein L7V32_03275 [Luminiphilus sp.]|nr:hypothetical protein [Luminiphilus sp.]